jgi:AcrR family transcriptional regulator
MARPAAPEQRELLLSTARAVLAEQGLAALSLREVARRAGVSHQTPYHHFGTRSDILAALAAAGFSELAQRLRGDLPPTLQGRERLLAAGRIYVAVARREPALFRLMFSPEQVDLRAFPAASDTAADAYAALAEVVAGLPIPPAQHAGLTAAAWALAHGIACLVLDGPPGMAEDGGEAFAEHVWSAWSGLLR